MNSDSDNNQRFCEVFEIPEFMMPWLDRFFEKPEIDLVLMLADRPMHPEEIAARNRGDHKLDRIANLGSFLDRAYKRGIINRRKDGRFEPADLHTRYDVWAMFEGWKDIPEAIREQLNDAELAYSERHYQDSVQGMKKGQFRNPADIYAEYILLHESEALIDMVDQVYLLPCNCRSMLQRCDRSVYTCLRFDNYRNLGWELSKSRAKEIIQTANQQGLMQTAEVALTEAGAITGAICNCCADCCVHPALAERYDAQNIWPLSRYVAQHLTDRCIACGLCTKRCPFKAFSAEKLEPGRKENSQLSIKNSKIIQFKNKLCRGCGVCSTACPQEAITMIPLDTCNEKHSLITQRIAEPKPASAKSKS